MAAGRTTDSLPGGNVAPTSAPRRRRWRRRLAMVLLATWGGAGTTLVTSGAAGAASNGTVTGTVTSSTGSAASGVCVNFILPLPSGQLTATATTDSNGNYSESLAPGNYDVEFDPSGNGCGNKSSDPSDAVQWWKDATGIQNATTITVTSSGSPNISATLVAGATLSGKVTAASGGAGIASVCVWVSSLDGNFGGLTGSDGSYSITGIVPGTYRIEFDPSCGGHDTSPYAWQYYTTSGGPPSFSDAAPVPLSAGSRTIANAALGLGASVSGTVTAAGVPQGSVCVTVISSDGLGQVGTTASDGTYSIGSLPSDTYIVEFDPTCRGTVTSSLAPQYYQDAENETGAKPLSLSAGQSVKNIDGALLQDGAISGTLTADGSPIQGACVSLLDGSPVRTASDGAYTISDVAPGTYAVQFDPTCQGTVSSTLAEENYDAAVVVSSGTTTAGINGSLVAGGTIAGTVTGAMGTPGDGQGLGNVCVEADGTNSGLNSTALTDSSGNFNITNLLPGSYTVKYYPATACGFTTDTGYATAWSGGATDSTHASTINVEAGQTATADVALPAEATISGVVNASGTTSVDHTCVNATNAAGDGFGAFVGANGGYTVPGLPAGSYTIEFDPACLGAANPYALQWYNNDALPSTANTVTVTAGQAKGGIDATLAGGGTITGTVTAASGGTPLVNVCVFAYEAGTNETYLVNVALTFNNGSYRLTALPAGSYDLRFSPTCGGLQNYQDQTTSAVSVTASQTRTGINAALTTAPANSGTGTPGGSGGGTVSSGGSGGGTVSSGGSAPGGLSGPSGAPGASTSGATGGSPSSGSSSGNGATASPPAAPLPVVTPPHAYAAPVSASVGASTPTTLSDSAGASKAKVSVPAGALPPGTTISVAATQHPSLLAEALPSPQSFVTSFAVSWVAPGGTTPRAGAPITMTVSNPAIHAGDDIWEIVKNGLRLVGKATKDGSVTITFETDPDFVIAKPPMLLALRRKAALAGGRMRVVVGCNANGRCHGRGVLRARGRVVAVGTFNVAASKHGVLVLKSSKAGRALLATLGRRRLAGVLTVVPIGGTTRRFIVVF